MRAYLWAHVLEENHSLCFVHQTDSFISFAFCLNQKNGLEKFMHTSLPSLPTMVRLSQWEKSFKTFGVFGTPSSGWKGSEWEKWSGKCCKLHPRWSFCTWCFSLLQSWCIPLWGGEGRGRGTGEVEEMKCVCWILYKFFPKMAFANLPGHHVLPFNLPRCFPFFLIVTKPFSTSLPERCDADSSTSLLEEKSRRLLKTVII